MISGCVAVDEVLLGVLEGSEINGRVGEHADETHWETAVEGADAGGLPHLDGGSRYQSVTMEAAFDSLALHTTGCRLVKG